MQTQNIWPRPNDDKWPLATVFDVTAKSALHHHNDVMCMYVSRVARNIYTVFWDVVVVVDCR